MIEEGCGDPNSASDDYQDNNDLMNDANQDNDLNSEKHEDKNQEEIDELEAKLADL